jgi:hypothetical protein
MQGPVSPLKLSADYADFRLDSCSSNLCNLRNLRIATLPRLAQNRQCTHLSFVQAQHYRVALERFLF